VRLADNENLRGPQHVPDHTADQRIVVDDEYA
jgi:hypothetical protein